MRSRASATTHGRGGGVLRPWASGRPIKEEGTPAARQRSRRSVRHGSLTGRWLGPLSPPAISQSSPRRSREVSGPRSGSALTKRTAAGRVRKASTGGPNAGSRSRHRARGSGDEGRAQRGETSQGRRPLSPRRHGPPLLHRGRGLHTETNSGSSSRGVAVPLLHCCVPGGTRERRLSPPGQGCKGQPSSRPISAPENRRAAHRLRRCLSAHPISRDPGPHCR